jgi:hypothetical protein
MGAGLEITTTKLPSGTIHSAYAATIEATGGTAPYAWSIAGGKLPATLTLTSTGAIVGTPTTAAAYTFTIQVKDMSTPVEIAEQRLSLVVQPTPGGPLTILTQDLAPARIDMPYSADLVAAGGTTPVSWYVSAGVLPPELVLYSSAGKIMGTPTEAGAFTFTLEAVDSAPMPATAQRTFTITSTGMPTAPPLRIDTAAIPAAMVHVPYSSLLAASGGTPPYAWSIASGTLPTGFALSTGGIVNGIATSTGTAHFTVQVKDAAVPRATATQVYDFVISM